MSALNKEFPSFGLRALVVLCALAVVSLLYLPLPVLQVLEHKYGVGATGMISAFGFTYAAGFLVFGPLSDRLGRRKVMVGGLLALTVITALLAIAETQYQLVIGRLLQGLVAASFPPVAIAYLAERGTTRQRAWSIAWMSTAFLSAGLLGQIYGGLVTLRWGIGAAFLPLSGIYALTAWLLWRAPKDKPVPLDLPIVQPKKGSLLPLLSSLLCLLVDPALRRVYVPAFFLLLCFVAFYMGLDMRFTAELAHHDISPLMLRALAAPAFLMPLAVAVLIPRVGADRVISTGLICATTGLALVALIGSNHISALLVASLLFVAGIGISVPGLIIRVSHVSHASVRGMAVGLYTFVLWIGASLGPWLALHTAHLSLQNMHFLLAGLLGACALYSITGLTRHSAAIDSSSRL